MTRHPLRASFLVTTVLALALALAALVGACAGDARDPDTLPDAPSYQLRFERVTLEAPDPGFSPEAAESVGVGREVRLDLRVEGDEVIALLSAEWAPPVTYRGDAAASPIMLLPESGAVFVSGATTTGTNGTLSVLRITIDAWVDEGRVRWTGDATFEGTEHAFAGDVGWSYEASGTMRGRVDDVAPRARFARPRPLGAVRPWEEIVVTLSEPVHRDELLGRLHASGGTLTFETGDELGRVRSATLRPSTWWASADALEVWLDEGVLDPVGNAGTEERASFPMLIDVAPRAGFDFETAAGSAVTSWGGDAFDPPTWVECSDASAGCLFLYRAESSSAGVFARLATGAPFSRIRARLRVIGEEGLYGYRAGSTLKLTVAAAGEGAPEEVRHEGEMSAPDDPSLPEGYTGDTGWQTVELDLGRAVDAAGVVFHFADPWGYGGDSTGGSASAGAGAPLPPESPAIVVVDQIEVD